MIVKPQTPPSANPIKEITSAVEGAIPYWLRLMAALWNLLVLLLKKMGLFPFFKSRPWLFFVLIFFVLGPLVPIGLFLILLSLDAFLKQTWMTEDFVIRFETQEEILENILHQAKDKTPEPQDIYNAAIKMGCPELLADDIGFLYEKTRKPSQSPM